jgi:hypothetical protein
MINMDHCKFEMFLSLDLYSFILLQIALKTSYTVSHESTGIAILFRLSHVHFRLANFCFICLLERYFLFEA